MLFKCFRHILLCNVLTTILRPNFEEPLDTLDQLVEKKIILFGFPGSELWKQFLLDSSIYNKLGQTYIVADDDDHFYDMIKYDVMGAGTHAEVTGFLYPDEMDIGEQYHPQPRGHKGWYRSKEKLAGDNPYAGYLTNKKWHLNEVLPIQYETMRLFILIMTFKEMANHLLYFQQVWIIYNI